MKIKNLITFGVVLLTSLQIFSQKISKENVANYFDAESYIYENNYEEALTLFLKIEKDCPNNANLQYKIGYSYLNSLSNQIFAHEYLINAAKNISENYNYDKSYEEIAAPIETHLYLGISYRVHYELDKSLQQFDTLMQIINRKFIENSKDKKQQAAIQFLKSLVTREIEITNNAIIAISTKTDIKVTNMGSIINGKYSDHSPLINKAGDKFYFSSKRPKDNEAPINQDEDIFYCEKNDKGEWSEPIRLNSIINDEEKNEAICNFTEDEKNIIFFRCGYDNTGDVLISKILGKNNYSIPEIFRKDLQSKDRETHASFSRDLKQVFFTSNRKGGKGGRDIYVSRKLPNGKWGKAILLPDNINTIYDEEAPFIHPDGVTLYFSSKGHNSIGGYDIFRAKIKADGTFTDPENLGFPINTTNNDVSFTTNDESSVAYYSSNRKEGYGDLDIYQIQFINTKNNELVYKGVIYNNLKEIIQNGKIIVTKKLSEELAGISRTDSTGTYNIKLENNSDYLLSYSAPGYYKEITYKTPTLDEFVQYKKNFIPIKLQDAILKPYHQTDTVYFYVNNYDLLDDATTVLDRNYKKYDKNINTNHIKTIFNIESVGEDENIDKLRYETICSYFATKNINKTDIFLDNNYSDKEERVIYEIVVKEIPIEEIYREDIYIANILFAFDKYNIKTCYNDNLDFLADYLNVNHEAILEINGHCDYKGSTEYNYVLSFNRATTIKNYLVAKGNNPQNIIISKFGKDHPYTDQMYPDGRDFPAGRRLNRRVEFKMIKQGSTGNLYVTDYDIEKGEAMPKLLNSVNVIPTSELNKVSDKKRKADEIEKTEIIKKRDNSTNSSENNNIQKSTNNSILSNKFTIQLIALQYERPLSNFENVKEIKVHHSEIDDLFRYYVGEFNSKEEAQKATAEYKNLGYSTFVRDMSFLDETFKKKQDSESIISAMEQKKISKEIRKSENQEKLSNSNNNNIEKTTNNNQNLSIPENKNITSSKFTIQIIALQNEKPLDLFNDIEGIKIHQSKKDELFRYYVGEFNSREEALKSVSIYKDLGYSPIIRDMNFLND
ncbi:MAG: OmpA family protein [Bacteroidales bacterium]|jgi:outer membrane protein OmpA-like peptidoglycan-associated protein|nr:OmpA family protein [Bacteroidales bacterium]